MDLSTGQSKYSDLTSIIADIDIVSDDMDLECNAPTTMVEYDSDYDVEPAVQQGFSSRPMPGSDRPPTPGLGQPFEISNSEMHGSESDERENS